MIIDSKDISVVVQGPISGGPNEKPEDRYTDICLKSVRTFLPKATIILSTWKRANVSGLDYDVLVENEDPGKNVMGDFSANCFRQVASSLGGLKVCKTKYAIKMRADLILKSDGFVKFFIKYNDLPYDENYKVVKERVVMLSTCNPHRRYKFPYNASDWFFFGLTEDVRNIFDIPLVRKQIPRTDDHGVRHMCDSLYSAEQFIWFSFLSKYKKIDFKDINDISHDNIALSEKYFANNAILLTARQAGIGWLKYPGGAYAQIPCLSNSGLYTSNDYKRMVNRYAHANLMVIPNPLEALVYYIVYNVRFFVKEKNPNLYNRIIWTVNRKNHERVEVNQKKAVQQK